MHKTAITAAAIVLSSLGALGTPAQAHSYDNRAMVIPAPPPPRGYVVVPRSYAPSHGWHDARRSERRGWGDSDRDGVPNRYDRDRDGDGVPNRYDNRPGNANRY